MQRLQRSLRKRFPGVKNCGLRFPRRFRPLTPAEDAEVIETINASKQDGVGKLGCPKQEKWMAAHRDRIQAVMIGVGRGIRLSRGHHRSRAMWMQNNGLEWLHRMASEPGPPERALFPDQFYFSVQGLAPTGSPHRRLNRFELSAAGEDLAVRRNGLGRTESG